MFADSQPMGSLSMREPAYIRKSLQKARICVDEEGTEAVAATIAMISTRSRPPTPKFIADRPFLFLIRDYRDGTILFMGRVTDPSLRNSN